MFGPPYIYLLAQIRRNREPEDDAESFWYAISGDHRMKNFVTDVQNISIDHGMELSAKHQSSFISGLCPDLNTLPKLDHENMCYF